MPNSAVNRAIEALKRQKRNFVITAGVVGGLVALFLIPEIVNFQGSEPVAVDPNDPTQVAAVTGPFEQEGIATIDEATPGVQPARPLARLESPLEDARAMLDDRAVTMAPAAPEQEDSFVEPIPSEATPVPAVSVDKTPLEPKLSERELTWDAFRAKEVQPVFLKVRQETEQIMRELQALPNPPESSIFAMYSYLNGLENLGSGAPKAPTPEQAVEYLTLLDDTVTQAMVKEKVSRDVFLRWKKVSLGDVLERAATKRLKSRYAVPFNPRLTLSNLVLQRSFLAPGVRYDQLINRVDVAGYLVGNEAQQIQVYRNNELMQVIGISGPDNRGLRGFSFSGAPGTGVWRLRVLDAFGAAYEKTYQFYPGAERFRQDQNGIYQLPFPNYGYIGPNKALDRYFALQAKIPTLKVTRRGSFAVNRNDDQEEASLEGEDGIKGDVWVGF